jgi:hypothetical protein
VKTTPNPNATKKSKGELLLLPPPPPPSPLEPLLVAVGLVEDWVEDDILSFGFIRQLPVSYYQKM